MGRSGPITASDPHAISARRAGFYPARRRLRRQAEKRIFIIANNADGYGVDRCLATGRACGVAVATAYCRSREFAEALSFRKVDSDEITGAVPPAARAAAGKLRGFRRHRVHALKREHFQFNRASLRCIAH